MKKYLYILIFILLLLNITAEAQSITDYAVQVSAQVQKSPASITLKWKANSTTTSYKIFKKTKTAASWGLAVATLPASATNWVDNNVKAGISYEYYVQRLASNYTGHGYIYAGMDVPAKENPGKVILVIDDTFSVPLAAELTRLENDLRMEGWRVIRHLVKRKDPVTKVKSLIKTDYDADPANVKTVFLIGHVPVPYSGFLEIDGHPDHKGAWPADVFYGDMDGTWNDIDPTAETSASRKENWNESGDGKYDEDIIPSAVELEVGRVDMYNLPAFNLTEAALLRRYFDKDHAFRSKVFTAKSQALVDDNFGGMGGEAFGASAYKAFAPMFGDSNIIAGDYRTDLRKDSYLWSFGAGAGSYETASGVARTDSFVNDSLRSVFTMLFGSYFGDWDSKNNLLRAAIASRGTILTNVWSGRPHWIFHHMALGENIGYAARISQMDVDLYFRHPTQIFGKLRQTALMGDPTLRLHTVHPARNLQLSHKKDSTQVFLQWLPSADTQIKGYYIYRASGSNNQFSRIDSVGTGQSSYLDSLPLGGNNVYMVRAVKYQETASGSYFNLSPAVMDSTKATRISGIAQVPAEKFVQLKVYPNPTEGIFYIETTELKENSCNVIISDMLGKIVYTQSNTKVQGNKLSCNLSALPQGVYLVTLKTQDSILTQRIVKKK